MGWFGRSARSRRGARPTRRERRAAERTAKAEASLRQTERKIHEVADQIRSDLRAAR